MAGVRAVLSLLFAVLLLAVAAPFADAAPSTVRRISGDDRYSTAAAISAAFAAPGAQEVVVTTGEMPFDALSGSSLGSPILLVTRDTVPAATAEELRRLAPEAITVLGGPEAVSDEVISDLESSAPVKRVAGDDRYATAASAVSAHFAPGVDNVLVVSGETFADALAAGAVAAGQGFPLLLVESAAVPEATRTELDRLRPGLVTVIGGPSAVSDGVVAELGAITGSQVNRIAGADRYETSAVLARVAHPQGHADAFVATGLGFADAVAGGPAAGAANAPILLVPGTCVTDPVRSQIETAAVATMTILGGPEAVGPGVETLDACPPPPPPRGGRVDMIGDSVMLGAQPQLEAIPEWEIHVDAKVSRQFEHGIELIRAAASSGAQRIVVHLGTNGVINDGQFDRAMQAASGVPKVLFATIQLPPSYSYEHSNNDVLVRGAQRWGAAIVDWHSLSNAHPEYVARDGYHMTASGARAYAALVSQTL